MTLALFARSADDSLVLATDASFLGQRLPSRALPRQEVLAVSCAGRQLWLVEGPTAGVQRVATSLLPGPNLVDQLVAGTLDERKRSPDPQPGDPLARAAVRGLLLEQARSGPRIRYINEAGDVEAQEDLPFGATGTGAFLAHLLGRIYLSTPTPLPAATLGAYCVAADLAEMGRTDLPGPPAIWVLRRRGVARRLDDAELAQLQARRSKLRDRLPKLLDATRPRRGTA